MADTRRIRKEPIGPSLNYGEEDARRRAEEERFRALDEQAARPESRPESRQDAQRVQARAEEERRMAAERLRADFEREREEERMRLEAEREAADARRRDAEAERRRVEADEERWQAAERLHAEREREEERARAEEARRKAEAEQEERRLAGEREREAERRRAEEESERKAAAERLRADLERARAAERRRVEEEEGRRRMEEENERRRAEETAERERRNAPGFDQEPEPIGGAEPAKMQSPEAEIAQLKDQLLRTLAEAENQRRRAARDRDDAVKYAAATFARDMLTVGDNLRRALDAVPAEAVEKDEFLKTLQTGVEMVERELLSAFERHGIKRITPMGERFDANFHQAMFEVPTADHAPGTVVQVIQPGYVMGDRLLRPAMVGVARPPAQGTGRTVDERA